jgi:hypothetical protein
MQDQTVVTQLLTAHEHDLLELRIEVDALKAGLEQLRADMLVSFKHGGMPNKSAPVSRTPAEELCSFCPRKAHIPPREMRFFWSGLI